MYLMAETSLGKLLKNFAMFRLFDIGLYLVQSSQMWPYIIPFHKGRNWSYLSPGGSAFCGQGRCKAAIQTCIHPWTCLLYYEMRHIVAPRFRTATVHQTPRSRLFAPR